MNVVRWNEEDLKELLTIAMRDGGWMREDQEIDQVVLNYRKSKPLPTDPSQIAGPDGEGGDPKYDIKVSGIRIKFRRKR